MNPYGTLQSLNRQNSNNIPDTASMHQPYQQQQQQQPAMMNHYGTLTSITNNQQQPQQQSPVNRQMNHYGTLASINSSTLNNNRLPPTSHSSPYSQFNGSKDVEYPQHNSASSLPSRAALNGTPTFNNSYNNNNNNYDINNNPHHHGPASVVVPDSPTSNQSAGGVSLPRQSLSQYPRSSPEGSGSYPVYGADNKSSGIQMV